jgi:hypothetical protein
MVKTHTLKTRHLVMHAAAEFRKKGWSKKKALKAAWKNISPKKRR